MKYLFLIIVIGSSCNFGPPKRARIEPPKIDSVLVIDTDSTRLNLVVLKGERYFFIGIKTNSSVLKRISDSTMLDSLVIDAKELKRNVTVYGETDSRYPDIAPFFNALKKREMLRFQLLVDDKLNQLRIEK